VLSVDVVCGHDCVTECNRRGHSSSHSAGGFSDVRRVFAGWELRRKDNAEVEVVRLHSAWNISAPVVQIFAKFDI